MKEYMVAWSDSFGSYTHYVSAGNITEAMIVWSLECKSTSPSVVKFMLVDGEFPRTIEGYNEKTMG